MRCTGAGHSAAPVKVAASSAGIQQSGACAALAEERANSPQAEEQPKKRRQGASDTPDAATTSSTSSNSSTFIRPKKKLRFCKMSEGGDQDRRRTRCGNWEPNMDRYLVDLMLEEMHKKNYACDSFNTHSWTLITKSFNAALLFQFTVSQIKDHFRNLRKKFGLYEELLRLSGWGWDPETHTPIPGYEGACDEVIQVNQKYSHIRRKPFPIYDDMQVLCKQSMSTGDRAEGIARPGNKKQRIDGSTCSAYISINDYAHAIPTAPDLDENTFMPAFSLRDDIQVAMNISQGPETQHTSPANVPSAHDIGGSSGSKMGSYSSKRKEHVERKKGSSKKIGSYALEKFAEATHDRNIVLQQVFAADIAEASVVRKEPQIPSLPECLQAMKDMPDLPYQVFLKAMKMFTDPDIRYLFSVMADEDKVNWLTMMTSDGK